MNTFTPPSSERLHISVFGKCNVGKSSLVNAITNQSTSIVSSHPGTTTDPVSKSMEIQPLGPVVIIDTPGYDDSSILGKQRITKTKSILDKTDIAILVTDVKDGLTLQDNEYINTFTENKIPFVIVYNKCDIYPNVNTSKKDNEF